MDFSTTYQFSYQESRPIISNVRQSKNKVVDRVHPSLTKIEGTMNAPAPVQQFTHLVHPDHSYRLSYLLRQFLRTRREKYTTIESRQNKRGKTTSKQTVYASDKNISLFGKVMVHSDRPRSNCLLCSVEAVSRCCWPIGSLANSSRAPACVFKVFTSSLSSTPTPG